MLYSCGWQFMGQGLGIVINWFRAFPLRNPLATSLFVVVVFSTWSEAGCPVCPWTGEILTRWETSGFLGIFRQDWQMWSLFAQVAAAWPMTSSLCAKRDSCISITESIVPNHGAVKLSCVLQWTNCFKLICLILNFMRQRTVSNGASTAWIEYAVWNQETKGGIRGDHRKVGPPLAPAGYKWI